MASRETLPTVDSKLRALYSRVPDWRSLLYAVQDGEAEFAEAVIDRGASSLGISTSAVHSYEDIEVQAFILGIAALGNWAEVRTKSYLAYGAHWIDDFFDSPELVANPAEMFAHRSDIAAILKIIGVPGRIGIAMARRAARVDGVLKGLHRMLYGGLVQRSREIDERRMLVREYMEIATGGVSHELAAEIRTLQPEAYWTTNKTVLELDGSSSRELDFTRAEVCNLICAPALYWHDIAEEKQNGEASFTADEQPSSEELARMVEIGACHLDALPASSAHLYRLQFEFLALSFADVLPAKVTELYQSIVHRLPETV